MPNHPNLVSVQKVNTHHDEFPVLYACPNRGLLPSLIPVPKVYKRPVLYILDGYFPHVTCSVEVVPRPSSTRDQLVRPSSLTDKTLWLN